LEEKTCEQKWGRADDLLYFHQKSNSNSSLLSERYTVS
jgi:hypothetical protein